MELRPARQADLPQINGVYRAVIRHMEQGGLKIWDEIYPCCCFPQDIAEERLYRKNGWKQVDGGYHLELEGCAPLHELGFELVLA